MPDSVAGYLGPYGRVAYGFVNEKTHYTLDQRGAWLTAWCMTGLRPGRDGTVKLKPLRAAIGAEMLDFLISEGDLTATDDPELLTFKNFPWANEPMERNRRNVKAYRDRQKEAGGDQVDSSPSANGKITRDVFSHSHSHRESTNEDGNDGNESRDDDPLWIFYSITNDYPNAPKLKRWIVDVAALAPNVRDFGVVFASEWRDSNYDVRAAMKSTAAKLSSMADRAAAAKKREPKPVDPWRAEMKAAMLASGAYDDEPVAYSNGASVHVEDVLASRRGGQGQPLTDVGTVGSPQPTRGPGRSSPSSPGSRGPSVSERTASEASTDEAAKETT